MAEISHEAGHQQHPLSIYIWIWVLLFVFSAFSYATDFLPDGYLRWSLIIIFMLLKAGFIIAVFMHMMWERMALIYAIIGPPMVLLVLIGLMAVEGDYTVLTRLNFFGEDTTVFLGHGAAAEEH